MRIAVGSTGAPKVEALKEAWQIFSSNLLDHPDETVQFLPYDIKGTQISMPLSIKDLMTAASDQAESLILQLKREKAEADFYVGVEAGFNIVDCPGARRQVFLESWAYVSDGHDGFFGHGGGVFVPPRIANPVVDRGIELGIVIDRFTQEKSVRSNQDTWGVLTNDILDRKHSFVIALIGAFAPFYNPQPYH